MGSASDTFSGEAAGTNLSAHVSDSGHGWTYDFGTGWRISSTGTLYRVDLNVQQISRSAFVPASAEVDQEIDVLIKSSVSDLSQGVVARLVAGTPGQETDYIYDYRWSSSVANRQWRMFRTQNNVFTALGTYAESLSFGVSKRMQARCRNAGKVLALFEGGVWVDKITSSDNVVTANGGVGLRSGSGPVSTDAGGCHLDNWTATDVGGVVINAPAQLLALRGDATGVGVVTIAATSQGLSSRMDAAGIGTSVLAGAGVLSGRFDLAGVGEIAGHPIVSASPQDFSGLFSAAAVVSVLRQTQPQQALATFDLAGAGTVLRNAAPAYLSFQTTVDASATVYRQSSDVEWRPSSSGGRVRFSSRAGKIGSGEALPGRIRR
jgi:hypothetical protein